MFYYWAILAEALQAYKKCPKCTKLQHFQGKKRGEPVTCKKCGHSFVLK
jgi:hypothetical protein